MRKIVNDHVSDNELSAYLLGKLCDESEQKIEDHLARCKACEGRAAEAVPRDSLVDLLLASRIESHDPSLDFPAAHQDTNTGFESSFSERIPNQNSVHISSPMELNVHPRYRLIRQIGRGGMGEVWLAEHLVMGRPVALKMVRSDLLAKGATIERFQRELMAAAKLNHPNIAHGYDADQVGDTHFLVMEYIDGVTLADCIKAGPLSIQDACRSARDAALGLAHAHQAGLVHRDIKPRNLMRAADGTLKVLDFGLVISTDGDSALTDQNMVMGTPDYIAPEQAEDPHQADARSDIYSLGCTLYELLAGRVPFEGNSPVKKIDAHRQRSPQPLTYVPPKLREIVSKMMAKEPARRYQSANEVADALAPFCEGGSLTEATAVKKLSPRVSKRSLLPIAFGLLAIPMLAAVVYRIQTDHGELVITTEMDDVEILVKQGGKTVEIMDAKTKQRISLRSGTYDLEVNGRPEGLKLDLDKVTITRGDEKIARIEKVPGPSGHVPLGSKKVTKITDNQRFEGPTSRVRNVAWSPDSKTVFAVCDDGILRTWDRESGKLTAKFNHGPTRLMSLCVIDGGRTVVTATEARLHIWDVATAKELAPFPPAGQSPEITSVGASPDGNLLATGSVSGRVRIWDVAKRKIVKEWPSLTGLPSYYVAWSPDGKHVLAGEDSLLTIKTIESETPLRLNQAKTGWLEVQFGPGKKTYAGVIWGGHVYVHDGESGNVVSEFWTEQDHGLSAARLVYADADHLITGCRGPYIDIWNWRTKEKVAMLEGHRDQAGALSVSPDSKWLASGSEDSTVRIWRLPKLRNSTDPNSVRETTKFDTAFSNGPPRLAVSPPLAALPWDFRTDLTSVKFEAERIARKQLRRRPQGVMSNGTIDSVRDTATWIEFSSAN